MTTTFGVADKALLAECLRQKGVTEEALCAVEAKGTVKAYVLLAAPFVVEGYISMPCAPLKQVTQLRGPVYVSVHGERTAFDASVPREQMARTIAEREGVNPGRVSITGDICAGETLACVVAELVAEEEEEQEEECGPAEISAEDVAGMGLGACRRELVQRGILAARTWKGGGVTVERTA